MRQRVAVVFHFWRAKSPSAKGWLRVGHPVRRRMLRADAEASKLCGDGVSTPRGDAEASGATSRGRLACRQGCELRGLSAATGPHSTNDIAISIARPTAFRCIVFPTISSMSASLSSAGHFSKCTRTMLSKSFSTAATNLSSLTTHMRAAGVTVGHISNILVHAALRFRSMAWPPDDVAGAMAVRYAACCR